MTIVITYKDTILPYVQLHTRLARDISQVNNMKIKKMTNKFRGQMNLKEKTEKS